MSHAMEIGAFLVRTAASIGFAYTLFVLWMAAGLVAVLGFALLFHGALNLARHGDRPLEEWPFLRRLFR